MLAACGSTADAPAERADAGAGGREDRHGRDRHDDHARGHGRHQRACSRTSAPASTPATSCGPTTSTRPAASATGRSRSRSSTTATRPTPPRPSTRSSSRRCSGMVQLLGSPVLAALKQNLIDDKLHRGAGVVVERGARQPVHHDDRHHLRPGDHQRAGLPAAAGPASPMATPSATSTSTASTAATACGARSTTPTQHNLTVREAKITSTDNDLTNIVTGFRGDGRQGHRADHHPRRRRASALTANQALGLNVPVLGNNPIFDPALLPSPAAGALGNLYVAASSRAVLLEDPQGRRGGRQVQAAVPGLAEERRRALRLRRGAGVAGRAGRRPASPAT